MVRHIVFWNLKESAEGADKKINAAKIKAGLEGLVGQIDGLLTVQVMRGYDPQNYDLCLYSEFASREALQSYKVNEKHKTVQAFVHKVITDRVAFDCEV